MQAANTGFNFVFHDAIQLVRQWFCTPVNPGDRINFRAFLD